MGQPPFTVPDHITFEQAIALTQDLIQQLNQQRLSDADSEAIVRALVSSENGARGFFVTYLTDKHTLADHPSTEILQALRSAPKLVADLMVKNLAMSTAMVITHQRSQQITMAQDSEQVKARSLKLIQLSQIPEAQELATEMVRSAMTQAGTYAIFLSRWGYDAEQRLEIQQAFQPILNGLLEVPWKS